MNTDKENKDKNSSQYTTVKTVYARTAMLLLAANFCLTVYCFLSLSSSQQEQIDGMQGISSTELSSEYSTANPVTDQTTTRDQ